LTLLTKEGKVGAKKVSPFSVTTATEMKWETMTSREQPSKEALLNCSDNMANFCKDLAVVGMIGSIQALRIYFQMNKTKLNRAVDQNILKKHLIIRGNNPVPVYTLGPAGMFLATNDLLLANEWKTYDKYEVLRKLVFFQLYGNLKGLNEDVKILPSEKPFTAAINRNGKEFHILTVRGNENEINQFFKHEQQKIPQRILVVVEEFNHLKPVQAILKPFSDRIRLTTDLDLNEPFERMFYHFKDNVWVKEYLGL
jgi:hypothetical protein